MDDYTISSGTHRLEDLIPRFVQFLKMTEVRNAEVIQKEYPEEDSYYWTSEEAVEDFDELWRYMEFEAPHGYYFGAHPGDGALFGFWPAEEEDAEVCE